MNGRQRSKVIRWAYFLCIPYTDSKDCETYRREIRNTTHLHLLWEVFSVLFLVQMTCHYDRVVSPTFPLYCTDHQRSQKITISNWSKILNMPKEDPWINLEIKATIIPYVNRLLESNAYIFNVVSSILTLTSDIFRVSRDLRSSDVQRTMRHDLGIKCYYGCAVYPKCVHYILKTIGAAYLCCTNSR